MEDQEILKLERITVKDLFNQFNYDIQLDYSRSFTILYGINGTGKTTILKAINELLAGNFSYFQEIPIKKFILFFNKFHFGIERSKDGIFLIFSDNKKPKRKKIISSQKIPLDLERLFEEISPLPFEIRNQIIDDLRKIPPRRRRRILREIDLALKSNRPIDIYEIIEFGLRGYKTRYSDHVYSAERTKEKITLPDWYNDVKERLPSSTLIREQRLIRTSLIEEKSRKMKHLRIETVTQYAENLAEIISNTIKSYANESQRLDQEFPIIVLEQKKKLLKKFSKREISKDIERIEQKRKDLQQVGLLVEKELSFAKFKDFDTLDDSFKAVLGQYIEDNENKLDSFNDLYEKVLLFQKTINNYFRGKKLRVDKDHGFIIILEKSDKTISTNKLSSGEKNILVMTYELIFNTSKNSIVLIDEPEISLHVKWQKHLVDDLIAMGKPNNITFILATHSPVITSGRWDYTKELMIES